MTATVTHPGLKTPFCDQLGIDVPIVLAGMGGASGPELAAAVSNAGGLGVLGCTGMSGDEVRETIRKAKELTDRPLGVDVILPAQMSREEVTWTDLLSQVPQAHREYALELIERFGLSRPSEEQIEEYFEGRPPLGTGIDAQIDAILDEKVALFASGLGSPGFMLDRAHAQGMKVMAVVGNVRAAQKVVADRIDYVVAQGYDGGGHTGRVGTFSLIPQVIDAVGDIPVLSAGGVADGRGVAASIAFGCQGAWIGTRFLASEEANIPRWKKEGIVEARDTATRITRSYTGKTCRVIRNAWIDAWEDGPLEPLGMPLQPALVQPLLAADPDNAKTSGIIAGQSSGIVKNIQPAGDIVREMIEEANEVMERLNSK